MATHTEQQTQMHAHSTHVRSCLTADPEHAKVALHVILHHLALVDGSDTQLALDSRDERRTLEDGALELLQCLAKLVLALDGSVQASNRHVLFTRALLRLNQPGRTLHTHDKAARHLRIQRATVPCLLHAQDPADPCHHLVTGGVGGLVKIDYTVAYVVEDWALERRAAVRDRRVVPRADVELVVVLEQQRPLGRVELWRRLFGLDREVIASLLTLLAFVLLAHRSYTLAHEARGSFVLCS
mmetsp:Transcript_944/g.1207  ORF Transcript_944/g.1207 Transcript_944/m.1207 type:complete len:241 (+) Transcript_944:1720-2442(+)